MKVAKTVADIQQAALTPDQIIKIIIRRRWYIILPFCVSLTIGLYMSFTLPRTYQAKTSILVQPQEVPGSYVRSIVST
ncbi:MAG: Wzz/FepE/Etk N-terminal domain-containing protein, partial [Thermodesulfobacteriota bacterium]|nr:Wzz/FepE/Etk N-terminal domain-containing protein [Thermodesulfobacteriota bacterium]